MYRIVNETCQGVQPETARKLLEALARKRIEDRKAKRVSDRYLTTRQRQARFEERLERMSGY